jgi:DNA invertase Pin-like site-specific DNA recombinase
MREDRYLALALRAARRKRTEYMNEWEIACHMFATSRALKRTGTNKADRANRDQVILVMAKTIRPAEIARITGYSRQHVYNILKGGVISSQDQLQIDRQVVLFNLMRNV